MKSCLAQIFLAMAAMFTVTAMAAGVSEWAIQDLIVSWANGVGRKVAWEAGDVLQGLTIRIEGIDSPKTAHEFGNKLNALNQLIAYATPTSPVRLVACIYDDVVVVRTDAQPPCGKNTVE